MIIGQVNPHNEAVIPVMIRDSIGQTQTLHANIETGFSGYLSLPQAIITALQLTFSEARVFSLGNNAQVNFDM